MFKVNALIAMVTAALLTIATQAQTNSIDQSTSKSHLSTEVPSNQNEALLDAERLNTQIVTLYKAGKFDEAIPLANKVLQLRQDALGPDNPLITTSLVNLAELYIAKNDYKSAAPMYRRAIETNIKTGKFNDPLTVRSIERYTCLLFGNGQADEIKEFESRLNKEWKTSADAGQFWGQLSWRKKTQPQPEYPPQAKRSKISGTVVIRVLVDEQGNVTEAKSMCGGDPLLVQSSEDAAKKAKIEPFVVNGKAVAGVGYFTYKFVSP